MAFSERSGSEARTRAILVPTSMVSGTRIGSVDEISTETGTEAAARRSSRGPFTECSNSGGSRTIEFLNVGALSGMKIQTPFEASVFTIMNDAKCLVCTLMLTIDVFYGDAKWSGRGEIPPVRGNER
jgi:hypothetical protein